MEALPTAEMPRMEKTQIHRQGATGWFGEESSADSVTTVKRSSVRYPLNVLPGVLSTAAT